MGTNERYRAVVDLTYPAPASLAAVAKAGGLSKMTPEQRANVTIQHAKAGTIANGLPTASVKWLLKADLITRVGAAKVTE
jgi:hypothetical protein